MGVTQGSPAPIRLLGALLSAALAVPATSAGQQTCTDRDPLYRFDGTDLVWSGVKGVSSDGSLLVVVTESYPAVHLFDLADGRRRGSWGRSGEGPGEFEDVNGVALADGRVYVLDGGQRRLSIFDSTGDLARTVNLRGGYYPRRLDRGGGATVLFDLSEPMGEERVIVARAVGASANEEWVRQDTVISYARSSVARLHLTAPGAPSYRVSPPYSPAPQWTPFSGGVALWPGTGPEVGILDLGGGLESAISLPFDDRFEVTADDREYWFRNAIPTELFGQRVFEPLRAEARRTVEFPRNHPLVFELLGGSDGRLWVRRTPDGRDQIWDIVDSQGQLAGRVSLTPRQALMTVIPNHLVVKITDDLGVESVGVLRCGSLAGSTSPATIPRSLPVTRKTREALGARSPRPPERPRRAAAAAACGRTA